MHINLVFGLITSALLKISNNFLTAIYNMKAAELTLLDFSKAFDTVSSGVPFRQYLCRSRPYHFCDH